MMKMTGQSVLCGCFFLLSDGAEVNSLSSSLSETIESYNDNFHKIEDVDNKLIVKFNELARKMINMTTHKHLLRDLMLSIQIQSQLDKNRQVFMNIKSYHLSPL